MYDVAQFSQRHDTLEKEIEQSKEAAKDLSAYLLEIQTSWQTYYEAAV